MQNSTNLKAEWVERIFMLLHGRFGNTFFNKYKIGKLNLDGDDAGLANAKMVWASELSGITPERIKSALEASYEHAPSCDDFKAKCVLKHSVADYKAIESKIDYEAGKVYADNVVKFVAERKVDKTDYHAWAKNMVANPEKYRDDHVAEARAILKA